MPRCTARSSRTKRLNKEIVPMDENKKNGLHRHEKQAEKKPKKEKPKKEPKPPKEPKPKKEKPPKEPKPKKSHKKLKIVLSLVLTFVVLAFAGLSYWGITISRSDVNLPRVRVDGIDVGGLTKAQTAELLKEKQWDEEAALALRVKLPTGVSFKLDPVRAGAKLTTESATEAAYRYGHSGNIYENLFTYIKNLLVPVDITEGDKALDESYIRSCIDKGIERFEKRTADKGYVVNEEKEELRIVKGAGQMKLDSQKLYALVTQALHNGELLVEYGDIDSEITMPDFNAIHTELAREPQDAYFEGDDFQIVKEVIGCSFDITAAEALWQAAEPGDTVKIPLVISYPEKTEELLQGLLFRDKLGSQTTYFHGSTDNRINNIQLAAAAFNGYTMMPGDVFSYNTVVGQRTTEAGYLPAGAYNDGQVVQEVGGGICQVSSTLYCAAMFAQMDTVERTSHYFPVNYLGWGLDATVSWPGPDYKFKNSREYPVKILTYVDTYEKSVTVEIWGTDVDGSYVELQHSMGVIYDDEYTDVVVGYGVSLMRYVYDKDGNLINQIKEPYSVYNLHDEDIKWPEPEPSPEPSPEPTPPTGGTGEGSGSGSGEDPDYSGPGVIIPPDE